jgi:hypothetical protein
MSKTIVLTGDDEPITIRCEHTERLWVIGIDDDGNLDITLIGENNDTLTETLTLASLHYPGRNQAKLGVI